MNTLGQPGIKELIRNHFSRDIVAEVYNDMRSGFRSSEPVLDDIISDVLSKQGKGVRPLFMALIAELVGGDWDALRQAAVVVEAIHLSSLMHDDVVDGSDLRRGKETLNARHSDKVSVLFGDHIFHSALVLAGKLDHPEAGEIVHTAVKRMIEGEILDSLNERIIDEATYIRIIGNKTASLFAAAAELGVVFSNTNGDHRVWAREMGELVGTAFQIVDDTLDFKGSEDVMGKPALMDMLAGNMTLPLIYSLNGLSDADSREILDGTPEDMASFVREKGGIEYSMNKAVGYLEDARLIKDRFDSSPGNTALDSLFDLLMNRQS